MLPCLPLSSSRVWSRLSQCRNGTLNRIASICTSSDRRARTSSNSLTHSYVEGSNTPPLHHKTLPDYFETVILPNWSESLALVTRHERASTWPGPSQRHDSPSVHWTFDEFDARVAAVAKGLLKLGIVKGDRIAVLMGNNSAYAILQWACARVGAVLATINPASRADEIIKNLKLIDARILIVVPRIRSSDYLKLLSSRLLSLFEASPGCIHEPTLPSLRHLIVFDDTSDNKHDSSKPDLRSAMDFRELLVYSDHVSLTEVTRTLDEHDVMNLQFTSGTTGAPKAVSLTHHNLLNNGWFIGRCMNLTRADSILQWTTPDITVFFDTRFVLGNLAAWTHGACIVYASEVFNPHAVLAALHEERCTAVHGVPTHFLGLLDALEKDKASGEIRDLSHLRTGIAAGSPIPIDLMRQLISKLNLVDLSIAYGMTETSPVSFQTTVEDPLIKRVETVGKVLPHVKAKVVDEKNAVVPIDTPGELCVSGYIVQKGYWQDPKQTAQVYYADADDPNGTTWMHTGDTAIMDKEGYLK
ncbi:hypothetical protein FRB98_003925, partial [Tulasnella sp. 332]